MNLLILLDTQADGKRARIDKALERIKADYAGVTPVTWEYLSRDYTNLEWENYLPDSKGISYSYISSETKALWGKYRYYYDHVIFTVDPANWGAPGIGGWNLGGRFNNYYPQIVKVSDSDEWLYKIFAMEIFHAMDEVVPDELGVNLNTIAGMDFDNDIVHGENPKYGVPNSQTKTGYYTDFIYRDIILEFGDYIHRAYLKREKQRIERITQLKLLIEAITQLVYLLKKKKEATPFLFEPHSH